METQAGSPDARPAAPLTGKQQYMLWILALVYACHFVDRTIVLVLLEPIKREFALSDSQLGLVSGVIFALGTLLAALPMGTLADHCSRRNLLSLCIAGWSLMTLACGLATGFLSLLLVRFLVGAAEAGLQPTAMSMVADSTAPAQRSRALAIVHTGFPVGILAGSMLGGWIAMEFGWRDALLVAGGPGLLLALGVAFTLREPVRQRDTSVPESVNLAGFFRVVWSHKPLLHVVSALVLLWLCATSSSAWQAPFLVRSHGLSLATVGMIISASAGIGGFVGNFLAGTLVQRLAGARRDRLALFAMTGAIAYFPLSLIAFQATSLTVSVTTFVAQTGAYFMIFTPAYSLAMDLAPINIRARTAALISMGATAIGYGVGPQVVGVLSDLLKPVAGIDSLRHAISLMMLTALWCAGHFATAWFKLRTDGSVAAAAQPA